GELLDARPALRPEGRGPVRVGCGEDPLRIDDQQPGLPVWGGLRRHGRVLSRSTPARDLVEVPTGKSSHLRASVALCKDGTGRQVLAGRLRRHGCDKIPVSRPTIYDN